MTLFRYRRPYGDDMLDHPWTIVYFSPEASDVFVALLFFVTGRLPLRLPCWRLV